MNPQTDPKYLSVTSYLQSLQRLYENTPNSPFKTIVYKQVQPEQKNMYNPHMNRQIAMPIDIYDQFEAENPMPDSLVPDYVIGFEQLHARKHNQDTLARSLMEQLNRLKSLLNDLNRQSHMSHNQMTVLSDMQNKLEIKLINVLSKIHQINMKGIPLSNTETELQQNIRGIKDNLMDPKGPKASLDGIDAFLNSAEYQNMPVVSLEPSQQSQVLQTLNEQTNTLNILDQEMEDDLLNIKVMLEEPFKLVHKKIEEKEETQGNSDEEEEDALPSTTKIIY
ncbi:hypothetical protein WA158_004653 [Blastocystis sp. Blastoise]